MIITDDALNQGVLRQISTPVSSADEAEKIKIKLLEEMPAEGALGLSAPQIGIFKRAFLCLLSDGLYFVSNPDIYWKSSDKVPSTEGCLSLPGITRCVERHQQVKIKGDFVNVSTGESRQAMSLRGGNAPVVQHETDHLDGILIIDLPAVKTSQERSIERQAKRKEKITSARKIKKSVTNIDLKPQSTKKRSSKDKKKAKRAARKRQQREHKCVEIQERFLAEKEGLEIPKELS